MVVAGWRGWGGERDGRHGEWQRRQLHQQQHVVVGSRAVQPQPAAAGAAMYQHPATFAAYRDRDRLHAARAIGLSVARNIAIKVLGPQATGTMIAM